MLLHPERDLAAFGKEGFKGGLGEEFEEFLRVGEAARRPDEIHVAAAEGSAQFEAHAHRKAHDLGGVHELPRGGHFHVVVIDYGKVAYALDPRIHDEVRGAFAALGVGVVDMVVHGELVPLLGHLDEVMLVEEFAHDAGIARSGLAEVVDELELGEFIMPRTDDGLHDLDEDAARIIAEGGLGAVEHFVVQGAQGGQAVFGGTGLVQAAKKVDDSLRHAILVRGGEVEYAVRMEAGFEYLVLKIGRRPVVNDIIDHFQEFSILPVEVEHFSHSGHLRKVRTKKGAFLKY